MSRSRIILDLCGGTGSWSKPYKDAGYDVRLITLPHYDVQTYKPPKNVYGILAAPPCTAFSVTGKREQYAMEKELTVVKCCFTIIKTCVPIFWALENPVGFLQNYIGPQTFTFQPWEFGDKWTKKTAVWGMFNIPVTLFSAYKECPGKPTWPLRKGRHKASIAYGHKNQILLMPQLSCFRTLCKTDADARAITPPGFAKAFFKENQ